MRISRYSYCGIVLVIVSVFLVKESIGQIPFFGRCPKYDVVENFQVGEYAGKWYEIEKYFAIFEAGGKCISALYTDFGNGTVGVYNSQIQIGSGNSKSINGTARILSSDGSGRLGVTFPSVPFSPEAPYWVLKTDYKNFSIVWSCNNFGLINFQIVWFLSREREPSEIVRQKVYTHLKYLGINTHLLQTTDQENCPE